MTDEEIRDLMKKIAEMLEEKKDLTFFVVVRMDRDRGSIVTNTKDVEEVIKLLANGFKAFDSAVRTAREAN